MHIPVSKIKHQGRGVDAPLLIWLYGKKERKEKKIESVEEKKLIKKLTIISQIY